VQKRFLEGVAYLASIARRLGVLATYDAGIGSSGLLSGNRSDLLNEAQTRTLMHHVLHPGQTVHVLTKEGESLPAVVIGDCSRWLAKGWTKHAHLLDFTGQPPGAEEAAEVVTEPEVRVVAPVVDIGGVRISTLPITYTSRVALLKLVEEGSDAVSPLYLWSKAARASAWKQLNPEARQKMSDFLSAFLKAYWAMENGSAETALKKLRDAAPSLYSDKHPAGSSSKLEWWNIVSAHVATKLGK